MIQPVLERRANDAVHGRQHLGVVQAVLGLSLKLRLLDEEAEERGHPFADVFSGEGDAFRREIVRVDEVAHRLADARAQAILVRAAGAGGNAVDVRAHVLVGSLGPLNDEIDS